MVVNSVVEISVVGALVVVNTVVERFSCRSFSSSKLRS